MKKYIDIASRVFLSYEIEFDILIRLVCLRFFRFFCPAFITDWNWSDSLFTKFSPVYLYIANIKLKKLINTTLGVHTVFHFQCDQDGGKHRCIQCITKKSDYKAGLQKKMSKMT